MLAILLPLPLSSPEPPTSDLGPSISSTPCLDAEAAAETVSAMAGVVVQANTSAWLLEATTIVPSSDTSMA